jgi:hypothetical protein
LSSSICPGKAFVSILLLPRVAAFVPLRPLDYLNNS